MIAVSLARLLTLLLMTACLFFAGCVTEETDQSTGQIVPPTDTKADEK